MGGANGSDASYYSQAAERRKKKNKKGCFHSPFFLTTARDSVRGIAQNGDRDGRRDIGVQIERDRIISDLLERSLRQADHVFGDLVTPGFQRLGNGVVGHGTEQPALDTSLLRDLHHQALELAAL